MAEYFKIRKGQIQKGFKILITSNLTNSLYYLDNGDCLVQCGRSTCDEFLLKASLKGILCALADVFWWKVVDCSCSIILFLDFLWCIFVNTIYFVSVGEMPRRALGCNLLKVKY